MTKNTCKREMTGGRNNIAYRFLTNHIMWIRAWIVIFYVVGFIGLVVPSSRPFFLELFPFAVLFTLLLLILFYRKRGVKFWLISFLIFFTGFIIEAIGVNSGYIFGNYFYGRSLGFKLFETPLIIGINWLLLSLLAASMMERIRSFFLKICGAAVLMLLFDIFLEQIAPELDMWFWKDNSIPVQNYIAWFILALLFQTLLIAVKINLNNKIVSAIVTSLFAFFFLLTIYFNFMV